VTIPDDYLNIDTPENVVFGYDVAGIGSRFLAALVDTFCILVLEAIVYITLFLIARNFFGTLAENDRTFIWLAALLGLIAFAFFWGYYIFFEMLWNGQSPGKRWVGLRVIRTDGTPVTLAESIIRNLVRLVDFLPAYYGVGVVTMFINEQSRRLGDLAAGTLVVRDRATVTLESLTAKPTPVDSLFPPPTSTHLPLERLSYRDRQIAEEFLRRRDGLTNRPALAVQLAQSLRQRMGLSSQALTPIEAETFIIELVQASQQRDTP
jgi:uncharacterized RDD family membrane protein YckC